MDIYSKSVLTVIAISLVWLCLRDASPVPAAQAQNPTRMTLYNVESSLVQCDDPNNVARKCGLKVWVMNP